jgi:tRNA(Arg) A34 adenosine deaminase TadA
MPQLSQQQFFMQAAIRLSREMLRKNRGGPFGALIVRRGKIIARGYNQVTSANDPTAHAEVVAIRAACKKLNTFSLKGCEIYCSCEPCPMCLSAIYWARIGKIYFAATKQDAAAIGFDDSAIYREVARPIGKRKIRMTPLLREEAQMVFAEWKKKPDKVRY